MEKSAIGFPFLNWSACSVLSLARVQRSLYLFMFSVGVSKPVSSVHIAPGLLRPEDVCPRVCYCHGQTAQHLITLIILHFFSAYPTVLDSLEWKRAPVTVGYICVVVKLHVCIYIYIYICVCVCISWNTCTSALTHKVLEKAVSGEG